MKIIIISFCLFVTYAFSGNAQTIRAKGNTYEPSKQFPFGRPNPKAPAELRQFAFMVGQCDCVDSIRNASTKNQWQSRNRVWDGKYIMNGTAIQDGQSSDKLNSLNIRVYDPKTKQWMVTFIANPTYNSGVWKGKKEGEKMIMRKAFTTSNGVKGESRLTFYNISKQGFSWKGEFVSDDGTIVYAFWKIHCKKIKS